MVYEYDSIFDTIVSLPAVHHSAAINTRCLDSRFSQPTRYMPDYGGVLDIPGLSLKNNSLSAISPFHKRSHFTRLKPRDQGVPDCQVTSNECIAVIPLLVNDNQSIIVKASSQFNLEQLQHNDEISVNSHECVASSNLDSLINGPDICGLKYSNYVPNSLVIKFQNNARIYQIDRSGNTQNVLKPKGQVSQKEYNEFLLKDACLNHFDNSIFATASNKGTECRINFYRPSISTYSRAPCQSIRCDTGENEPYVVVSDFSYIDKGKVYRQTEKRFYSTSTIGVQQIDNIPSHLFNMLITTSTKTSLVDPRMSELGLAYVDKHTSASFHPIEHLKRTEFSLHSEHQFYSMSNINLRVIDTRYPRLPVNQVSHMLDSSDLEALNMQLVENLDRMNEILCLSSSKRLCLITFNQAQKEKFINPISVHPPFHQDCLKKTSSEEPINCMFGLGVRFRNSGNNLFSVFRLSDQGDLCIHDFYKEQYNDPNDEDSRTITQDVIERGKLKPIEIASLNDSHYSNMSEKPRLKNQPPRDRVPELDILRVGPDLKDAMNSKRAMVRFEAMMKTLMNG